MLSIQQNKLVLFGAGKIGRSFIGQLFSKGGYEVVFVDINKAVIDELNKRGHYKVIIKSDKEEVLDIYNVRGVHSDDVEKIVHETATAGIVAVSVGQDGLESVFHLLAKGLVAREAIDINCPLDIIIAENLRNADLHFRDNLISLLPHKYPFDKLVGLVETSIGKMVPIMQKRDMQNDILQVFAEPYNTLILNKKGFKNPIPAINGLAPKDNMKAWVDRKLFIHNLGHSTTAYIGHLYNPGFVYLYEALEVNEIYSFVRETMLEAACVLMYKYPGEFSLKQLTEHIDDLIFRFQNRNLGDTIFRVGCDLNRKLGPQDRLAGAINAAFTLNLPYQKILYALVSGFHFRATDEDGKMLKNDNEFARSYEKGLKFIMTKICGFNEIRHDRILKEALVIDRQIKKSGIRYLLFNTEKLS
jgi:mannitol-1-phosphate 5-dehydrogenase